MNCMVGMRTMSEDARHRVRGQLGHRLLGPLGTLHARRDSQSEESQVRNEIILELPGRHRKCVLSSIDVAWIPLTCCIRVSFSLKMLTLRDAIYYLKEPCGIKEDIALVRGDQRWPIGSQSILDLFAARQLRRERVPPAGSVRSHRPGRGLILVNISHVISSALSQNF